MVVAADAGGSFRPQMAPKTKTNRLLELVLLFDFAAAVLDEHVVAALVVVVAALLAEHVARAQYRPGDRNES